MVSLLPSSDSSNSLPHSQPQFILLASPQQANGWAIPTMFYLLLVVVNTSLTSHHHLRAIRIDSHQHNSHTQGWSRRHCPHLRLLDHSTTIINGNSSEMTYQQQTSASAAVYYQSNNQRRGEEPFLLTPPAGSIQPFDSIDGATGQQTKEQQQCDEPRLIGGGEMSAAIPTPNSNASSRMAPLVFGPFHRLSRPFFPSEFPDRRRLAKNLLFYGLLVLLIGRAIFYVSKLGGSSNLSLEWARASLQLSITLNAVGVLGWMRQSASSSSSSPTQTGGGGAFPSQFMRALMAAIGGQPQQQNNAAKSSVKSLVTAGILATFFFYTNAVWALRRMLQVRFGNENIRQNGLMNNGTGTDFVRATIEQGSNFSMETIWSDSLLCLDACLALLAGFIGALGLAIFYLSFQSVLAQWDHFKRDQLDENKLGRMTLESLDRLSTSASALLRFAHFTSNKLEQLGMGMFMTAVFCNISASFINGGGGGASNGDPTTNTQWPLYIVVDKVNNVNWSIFSILLQINSLKDPYYVHAKVCEVKEQLLLENSLWNGSADPKLTSLLRDLVHKLSDIRIHRIGTQLFHMVFIAQMVLVWLLVNGSNCNN